MPLDLQKWARVGVLGLVVAGFAACDDDDNGGITDPPPTGQPGAAVLTGSITSNRTLSNDTTYTLQGFVQVGNGATLTVEPGTRIVGDAETAGSALFVLRGARLVAEGSQTAPIVFTSERAAGSRRPGDWGGVVMIGNARINRSVTSALTEGPAQIAQNYAGGSNDDDSSGSLRYVRIEYAGYDVSGGQGQELNGLSMYAVGRGTGLQYVQVHAGLDDSFEWFGGTVDGQYLVSSESGDDHFDWSEGYRGRNQFMVAFQSTRLQPAAGAGGLGSDPRGFEGDGCDPGVAGCNAAFRSNTPQSQPLFANFTMIGSREAGYPTGGNAVGMLIRRGTEGFFYNGVVGRYNGFGVQIRDSVTVNYLGEGKLVIRNVAFVENASTFDPVQQAAVSGGIIATELTGTAASYFTSLAGGSPSFVPSSSAAGAFTGAGTAVPASLVAGYRYGWQNVNYLGAVQPGGTNWLGNWTSFALN